MFVPSFVNIIKSTESRYSPSDSIPSYLAFKLINWGQIINEALSATVFMSLPSSLQEEENPSF